MKDGVDKIPTGKIARSTITGISAAKAGIKHLSYIGKIKLLKKNLQEDEQKRHEQDIGKILYNALSQLRGTALKVSQMLSIENGLLPETIRKELSKACHQVIPLNRALIYKVFINEFGTGYDKLFKSFDSKAFAAASLGQVHRALSFDGKELAVKIQYPGIASSIKSDIRIIRGLIPVFAATTLMFSKNDIFQTVIDEIEERLYEEVDYLHESKQTKWFSDNLPFKNIIIPRVILKLSGERVLTMEKIPGKHIQEWLKTNPSQEDKNYFGQTLFDFFLYSTFKLNKIHADPHPGNFIFTDDKRLGIIDFGCVKPLNSREIMQFCSLLKALVKDHKYGGNTPEIVTIYKDTGMITDNVTTDIYKKEIEPVIRPVQYWFIEPFINETFDFSKKEPFPIIPPYKSMNITQYFNNIPRDQIYFNRFYTGIMFLLEHIGAVIKTKNSYL
ncbi:MAG: AarF/ABC1/UbiB kinase family protein [Chitinispirillia bacterium]|jgi:predicted unusual protein kinase regulating ubiquinone biosynthesis (AarF/ABC1/UbiB family)